MCWTGVLVMCARWDDLRVLVVPYLHLRASVHVSCIPDGTCAMCPDCSGPMVTVSVRLLVHCGALDMRRLLGDDPMPGTCPSYVVLHLRYVGMLVC